MKFVKLPINRLHLKLLGQDGYSLDLFIMYFSMCEFEYKFDY